MLVNDPFLGPLRRSMVQQRTTRPEPCTFEITSGLLRAIREVVEVIYRINLNTEQDPLLHWRVRRWGDETEWNKTINTLEDSSCFLFLIFLPVPLSLLLLLSTFLLQFVQFSTG